MYFSTCGLVSMNSIGSPSPAAIKSNTSSIFLYIWPLFIISTKKKVWVIFFFHSQNGRQTFPLTCTCQAQVNFSSRTQVIHYRRDFFLNHWWRRKGTSSFNIFLSKCTVDLIVQFYRIILKVILILSWQERYLVIYFFHEPQPPPLLLLLERVLLFWKKKKVLLLLVGLVELR